ncbi:hypothetical protein SAMN05216378_4668 [Paenibacillus catalpae]|uniref:Uncharacterized protein n=1 Tax=Paenibacillus catalpae TaxID=1045775 RepID=A0A1I2F5H9_9BACL|nr:hypothetical protein [Paenibacillus catalpae]SFE99780.1 hypothetical protein SAMN05216378_4668 [Paenibacillus catalpae]
MKGALKWVLLGGVLVFIILYGVEMSSAGIERIYGPIESNGSSAIMPGEDKYNLAATDEESSASLEGTGLSSAAERKIADLEKELKEVRKIAEQSARHERLPGISSDSDEPAVNKVADGTAGLLQSVSSGGIRFIASLFNSVTG